MNFVYTYGYKLDQAVKAVKLDVLKRLQSLDLNITPDQWFILELLFEQPEGSSQNEIANATNKDAPTVSRIIDLLCKKNYTSRKPFDGDRRKHNIILTDAGHELVKSAQHEIDLGYSLGWNDLNNEDLQHLDRITNKIISNYSLPS